MDYTIIGKNIEELRNSRSLKQEDFATSLGTSRPTISNWEKGKNPPTTEQLIKIAEVYKVSIDELLGLKKSKRIMIVVDSSILCRRPRFLDDAKEKDIQYICITETVLSEMNYQKDKGRRHQQAWLAMKSFQDHKKEDPKRFLVLEEKDLDKLNDNNIINAALNRAKEDSSLMVYLISEDIYFPLKAKNTQNFKVLTLNDYEKKFSLSENSFDREASIDFYSAVNSKNIEQAKKILQKNPDINRIDAKMGFTPLIQAIRNKDESMIKFIVTIHHKKFTKNRHYPLFIEIQM